MQEVECYQLDIAGLTYTYITGSGAKFLERCWTLAFSGVAQGKRCEAGMGIVTRPHLNLSVLEFSSGNERIAFM